MKIDEYLEIVSEQIRYAKIRPTITEELKNHILDQAEAYEECGAFPEEALDRAVREMGDPVETGVSLDRIHRPSMSWGIVLLIGIISILSIGVFYAANIMGADMYPWQRQASFILAGFFAQLQDARHFRMVGVGGKGIQCLFQLGVPGIQNEIIAPVGHGQLFCLARLAAKKISVLNGVSQTRHT